jgi:molybdopterin-binding protein
MAVMGKRPKVEKGGVMNKIHGKIVDIESSRYMSVVEVQCGEEIFSSVALETPATADYLRVGNEVDLHFKETSVMVAKGLTGSLSVRNRCKGVVKEVRVVGVYSTVRFDFLGVEVNATITKRSAERLGLAPGVEAEWLVKTQEVVITPVGGACSMTCD